jgi:hypothetical protein
MIRIAQPTSDGLTSARLFAPFLGPWVPAVRLPILAFMLGICVRESTWWLLGGLLLSLCAIRFYVVFILLLPIGLIAYYLSHPAWYPCLLLGCSLIPWIETRCSYLQTYNQVDALLSDLLSPTSSFSFGELEIPPEVLRGFASYRGKSLALAAARRKLPSLAQGLVPLREPVRMFRFQPLGGHKATGAAAAFAVEGYSSLVFVRQSFEKLTDGQRLQVYHELGHGTPEGSNMLIRPLRWSVISPFDPPMFLAMCLLCATPNHDWHRWLALGFLSLAHWLRLKVSIFYQKISTDANEVLADSIALSHPDFLEGDGWKLRAQDLAKRLEGEVKYFGAKHPRLTVVLFRANWLRGWVERGRILPYLSWDVDLKLLYASVLYVLAGYYANVMKQFSLSIFVVLAALAIVGLIQSYLALRKSNDLLVTLDDALNEKLGPGVDVSGTMFREKTK